MLPTELRATLYQSEDKSGHASGSDPDEKRGRWAPAKEGGDNERNGNAYRNGEQKGQRGPTGI